MGLEKNCGLDLWSKYQSGERNLITDVPGVTVGNDKELRTTSILTPGIKLSFTNPSIGV